jgi:hypothetical protein
MLNNVPQPTQSLGQTQSLINANFTTIDTAFSVNHVPYGDGSGNQGKHNLVDFPVQGSAPSFASGDIGFYNLLNATLSKNELYIHKITGSGTIDIPFTASTLSTNASPSSNTSWFTYLPSGMQLRGGMGTGTGTTTVTLSGGIAFNGILTVILTPYSTTAGDVNFAVRLINIISSTQFSVYVSSRTSTGSATGSFQYLAIGY